MIQTKLCFLVVFRLLINVLVLGLSSNTLTIAAVDITESQTKYSNFTLEYLYDKGNELSINNITDKTFEEKISSQFALGYRKGPAWFKISINNHSQNDRFVLYFTEPFWTNLDLYSRVDGEWRIQRNGLEVPLKARTIPATMPSYDLEVQPGSEAVFYLRGYTVSSHIGEFQLFTHDAYYKPGRISVFDWFNIYSGILFFIMLLTSLLYFIMRERLYLYYTAYVLSFIIWISTQSASYLYLEISGWHNALHAIGALLVFFLVLFSRELLKLSRYSPVTDKVFRLAAVAIFACFIGISLDFQQINIVFNIISSMFFALLLVTAINAWKKNYFSGARYYLIALILYMPTMALMTLTYNGIIDYRDMTRYAFALGSFIEILFFSFILANRFIEVKDEKLQAQKALIDQMDMQSQLLECEVESRTSELNRINQKLLQQTKDLEEAKQKLSVDASTDALSGLHNRRYLLDKSATLFNQAKDSCSPLSILMLDIDRFKGINDTFGHEIGDKAIVACADTFKSHVGERDIVARFGGEEFIILMPQAKIDDALLLAEAIRKTIEINPICFVDEKTISLTLSIGATQINLDQDHTIDSMLQRADKALYMAKKKGRNAVVSLLS